jgi:hypothetical protein
MVLEDDVLVAAVATVTRRKFGTVFQILVELKGADGQLADLDGVSLKAALDHLVDVGRLRRDAGALYSLPRP